MASSDILATVDGEFLDSLIAEFAPAFDYIALIGSHARGTAGPFSDVDLLCLREDEFGKSIPPKVLVLRKGRLISITYDSLSTWRRILWSPENALWAVVTLRSMCIIRDERNELATLKGAAQELRWSDIQKEADIAASLRILAATEIVLKALNALAANDRMRAGLAVMGLTDHLAHAIALSRGILVETTNAIIPATIQEMGTDSSWSGHCREALGLGSNCRVEARVRAALALYRETAEHLRGIVSPNLQAAIDAVLAKLPRASGT